MTESLGWIAAAGFYSRHASYPLASLACGEQVVCSSDDAGGDGARLLVAYVFPDRCFASTRSDLAAPVRALLCSEASGRRGSWGLLSTALLECCRQVAGEGASLQVYAGVKLYCDRPGYRPHRDPSVQQITRESAAAVIARLRSEGIPDDPDYLLADDAAFIYLAEGEPAAFAATHPSGAFSDRIGDVMVGTREGFRRRGYGRAVVSATTGCLLDQGRVAVYGTGEENVASQRTALSVGYRELCRVLTVRIAQL